MRFWTSFNISPATRLRFAHARALAMMYAIASETVRETANKARLSNLINQHHRLAGDRLRPADAADAFAGIGFEVHGGRRYAEQAGNVVAHAGLVRSKLRLLREDRDIRIDHAPACLVQARQGFAQEERRVAIFVGGVGIGVRIADIA